MRHAQPQTRPLFSVDGVVLGLALVGLALAVMSVIGTTGGMRPAVEPVAITPTPEPAAPTVSNAKAGTDSASDVPRLVQDGGVVWGYNAHGQLVSPDTGALLPILGTSVPNGSAPKYFNQRGEEVDENGVPVQP